MSPTPMYPARRTGPRRLFQGRPLPRPAEDLEDQGLGFDIGTVLGRQGLDRRRMLTLLGLTSVALAGCGSDASGAGRDPSSTPATENSGSGDNPSGTSATSVTREIPEETAGPFPGDGSNGPDVLESSGIVRRDIRSSFGDATGTAEGVQMTLELSIEDLANDGRPFAGAAVYVWHCDRDGEYSLYGDTIADQNYLRGVQIADDAGKVRFVSIYPACYEGRWPHIHFEVYPDRAAIADVANVIATSQVALPARINQTVYAEAGYESSVDKLARVSLDSDGIFGDDGGASQLATVTGDVTDGYLVRLSVGCS